MIFCAKLIEGAEVGNYLCFGRSSYSVAGLIKFFILDGF